MKFKEIIKEHTEIYFDNKNDLEEFLDLCSKEDIQWSSGHLANKMGFVYNWFEKINYITIIYDNVGKLRHSTKKVDFTYNDFKKLLNPFDLAEFLKDNAVRVLDEQQFNDMFNILDKYGVKYGNGITDKWLWTDGVAIFHYKKDIPDIITAYTKSYKDCNNILSYQNFISIINHNNIHIKELTKQSLKQDVEMYLIKDKEATNSYNDLLEFIININNKYDLKLNL